MENFVLVEKVNDSIGKIILSNGKKINPLSLSILKKINREITLMSENNNIKVIIISSNGPGFSAGHDLKELKDNQNNKVFFLDLFRECSNLMQKIISIPQPVIAEVPGIAAAAGCQLVATCDLAIASEKAEFMTPGVNIGLFCSTPMVAVSRNVSRKKMMEMLLMGEKMSAIEAEKYGLVNKIVPEKTLSEKTIEIANIIAKKPKSTIKIGKEAFYKQLEMPLNEAYEYTSQVMALNMLEKDAKEGIEAFLEKKNPIWSS